MTGRFRQLSATAIVVSMTAFVCAPASSRDFYTKRRVNGEWVTGVFSYKDFPVPHRTVRKPVRAHAAKRAITKAKVAEQPASQPTSAEQTATKPAAPATVPVASALTGSAALTTSAIAADSGLRTTLQSPLQKKADSMAIAAVAKPTTPAEPVSVNYDYKTGIKTTWFANGDVSEELFDNSASKVRDGQASR